MSIAPGIFEQDLEDEFLENFSDIENSSGLVYSLRTVFSVSWTTLTYSLDTFRLYFRKMQRSTVSFGTISSKTSQIRSMPHFSIINRTYMHTIYITINISGPGCYTFVLYFFRLWKIFLKRLRYTANLSFYVHQIIPKQYD